MKRTTRPRKRSKSVFENPVVIGAIITGIVAIVTTWLTVWPNLQSQRDEGEEPPRQAETREAQPSATAGFPTLEPTYTLTPFALIPSETPTSTLTHTPTPLPGSLTCLDGWWLYPGGLDFKEEGREGCTRANIPELGFSTSTNGFQVTREKFRNVGIFGISTPLPENVSEIRLNVTVRTLYTAEFWIAISNSREFVGDTMILAVDPATGQQQFLPGSLRIYRNDFDTRIIGYEWSRLDQSGGQSTKPPFNYEIRFLVNGGDVEIFVNNVKLVSQIINFPRNLFLGFRNKSTINSVTMNVTITDLQIETDR